MIACSLLKQRISEISAWLQSEFLNPEGLVAQRIVKGDGIGNLIEHFDDYFPLMLHLGCRKFVQGQIRLSESFLYKGLYVRDHRISSEENYEFIGGLVSYYKQHKIEPVKTLIEDAEKGLKELLIKNDFICIYYLRNRYIKGVMPLPVNLQIPITSPSSGGLIETLVEKEELLDYSSIDFYERLLNKWLSTEFFRKTGLFPRKYFIYSSLNHVWALSPNRPLVQMFKHNTNFVYSLITAYLNTKKSVYKHAFYFWIKSVKERMFDEAIYSYWSENKGKYKIELVMNFPVIDILCDYYALVENKKWLLDFAEKIAEFWINERFDCNLFPNHPHVKLAFLDCQTDICISFMRLYELTKKEEYKKLAEETLLAILKYYHTPRGYVLYVDEKGNIRDSTVCPKYNALLLKPLILFLENKKMYENPYLHDLMEDR